MEGRRDTPEQAEFREYCPALAAGEPAAGAVVPPARARHRGDDRGAAAPTSAPGRRSVTTPAWSAATTRRNTAAAATRGSSASPTRRCRLAGVPYLINVIGLSMAAPTILHHGTEEQKRRYLPPLLSAEEIWCQGFSEPNAGSDLASVQTSAVRDGDNWIINGHKVWTSLAHFASWMILLARHSNADKYNGLTYFICPIAGAPGVTVRPLIKITGQTGFNEVLFEDAVIPDTLRVDEVGKGWQVAMTTLLHERGAAESAGSGGGAVDRGSPGGADRAGQAHAAQRQAGLGRCRHPRPPDADRHPRRRLPPDVPPRPRRRAHRPSDAPPAVVEAADQRAQAGHGGAGARDRRRVRARSTSATSAPPTAPNGRSPT